MFKKKKLTENLNNLLTLNLNIYIQNPYKKGGKQMNLKKVLSTTLVFFLSTSLIFSAPATVSAATNDVFGVTASFKGADETGIQSPNATFIVGMGEAKELGNDFCRRCGYCLPCTKGIDIPSCFMFEGYYKRYGLEEWAKSRYEAMGHHASECVECGKCLEKCPYKLNIINKLKEVAKTFGK